MSPKLQSFFEKMWNQYTHINKLPSQVFDLVKAQEKSVINDHIALRTFNHPKISIEKVAEPFLQMGYKKAGEYHFEEKKLDAIHLHCEKEPDAPKVFISELKISEMSQASQKIISHLIDQVDLKKLGEAPLCMAGRLWDCSPEDYQVLKAESEYASWMAAHGFIANHFTISINHMNELDSVEKMNQFLKDNGIQLNSQGGEIKGTPEVGLEQSSTIAEYVDTAFQGKKTSVPGCFIEFAKRYPDEKGILFQGFVTQSADKIFESTYEGQKI